MQNVVGPTLVALATIEGNDIWAIFSQTPQKFALYGTDRRHLGLPGGPTLVAMATTFGPARCGDLVAYRLVIIIIIIIIKQMWLGWHNVIKTARTSYTSSKYQNDSLNEQWTEGEMQTKTKISYVASAAEHSLKSWRRLKAVTIPNYTPPLPSPSFPHPTGPFLPPSPSCCNAAPLKPAIGTLGESCNLPQWDLQQCPTPADVIFGVFWERKTHLVAIFIIFTHRSKQALQARCIY